MSASTTQAKAVLKPSVPKYYLVKLGLLDSIADAAPGTVIPTERALAGQYEVSRQTVRQAIAELVTEGRLGRVQGSGTFVAPPRPTFVRQMTSFSDDAIEQGMTTASRILGLDVVAADVDVAEGLGCEVGATVHRLERVRLVNGAPLAHDVAYLPEVRPGLREAIEDSGSLYRTLDDVYGVAIVEVEDVVETALAGPEQCGLLDMEMGAPVMVIRRLARDGSGRPVEYSRSEYRGDRFRFVARQRR